MNDLAATDALAVAVAADDSRAKRSTLTLFLELSKARLCAMVLITTLVGFLLASETGVNWLRLALTLAGTALAAFGANAWNQCIEARRDARMRRTARRPLPSGELSPRAAWVFSLSTSAAGPLVLWLAVNELSAYLAILTLISYVGVYTPLKTITPFNTLVGAVCGAIPPMLGWAAASGSLNAGAWLLGGVLFIWQIPHFLALAWLYRDDYERGGFRMLPVVDREGRLTAYVAMIYSAALIPVTLLLTRIGVAGGAFAAGALVLGVGLVLLSARLLWTRADVDARRLFLASVIYLPLLLGLLVADRRAPLRDNSAAAGAAGVAVAANAP